MLTVGLHYRIVFPIEWFWVRLSPVLLESVVTILSWFRAKCAGHGIFVTNFLISLKCSTSLLVHFHSVFFRNSCLLRFLSLESLGGNFAIYCIARGLNLIFYLMSLILNLAGFLSTLHSVSFSLICCLSQPVFWRRLWILLARSVSGLLEFRGCCEQVFCGVFLCPPCLLYYII